MSHIPHDFIVLGGGGYLEDVAPRGLKGQVGYDKPNINLKAVVISAIVFIIIVVWYNVITNLFNEIFPDDANRTTGSGLLAYKKTIKSFWYAIFMTVLSLLACYIIYFL